jgi:hypothetical protein
VAVGMVVSAYYGQLPPMSSSMIGAFFFYLIVAASGGLITQELAFRRLLIGQSGGAGLAIVVGAAIVFAAWHLVIPVSEASGRLVAGAAVNGVSLGALYVLSRSLFVAAWFHGVQLGVLGGLRHAATASVGSTGLGVAFWNSQVVSAAVIAAVLGFWVYRQNGMMGDVRNSEESEEPDVTRD